MATQTAHFELEKPSQTDVVDVAVLNNNFDDIDVVMFANQERSKAAVSNAADAYDATKTYAVDALVIYENQLYKCTTAITTAEQWDSTKWAATTLAEEIGNGGGGGGNVEANPSGAATDTLSKIGIESVIYEILGGGGGTSGRGNAVGVKDVTNFIAPCSGIVLDSNFIYKAVQIGNVVFLNARGSITSGAASAGTSFNLFDIDQSIAPQMGTDNFAYGVGSSNRVAATDPVNLKIRVTTGSWCGFEIYWTVEEVYMGDTEYTFSPIIYSTEEREIGVWTDGRPLYQRTIELPSSSFPTASTHAVDTAIGETVNVIYLSGIYWFADGTRRRFNAILINAAGTVENGYAIQAQIVNNNAIRLTSQYDRSTAAGYVTIRYTKTADTPGSGIWTPSGVPAVHYSTEEQVVGTWIDGTTLYERTIIVTSPTIGAQTAYSNVISNFDKMIDWSASLINQNGRNYKPVPFTNHNVPIYNWSIFDVDGSGFKYDIDSNISGTIYVNIQYTKTTD